MPNGYQLQILPAAQRELAALPAKVRRRADAKIQALAENPRPPGCVKLAGEESLYRVRVGVYRIVYEIRDAVLLVIVVRVRHRREAYR